ncbi:MAG TPA: ABC transporter substrate-binding protein [Ktedonobacteraceae bacterium]|nr:ABC transporter substrate-binding protein [Ktedonobacteraceae bacterium]
MLQSLQSQVPMVFSRRKVWAPLIAILLACIFVLAACGGQTPPSTGNQSSNTPTKGGNIVEGLVAEPASMDPLTSASLYDADVMVNMYDTLLKYDVNSKIQPDLATSYTFASPTVLNLTLRNDVKFQDGTPFNADAVVFNISRFLNDPASPRFTDVAPIVSVQKTGDFQVQIKLKQPYAPMLNVLTGAVGTMLSPTAVKSLGKNLVNAPVNAGSGAFIFVEWIKGDHLLLKANPNYWKKDAQGNRLPYLQSIRFRTITNLQVMYNNLETAQVQIATGIDPNDVVQAKSNPTLTYRQVTSPGFSSIQLNVSQPPLNNVHVRRAIAYAINRQEILDHVLQGVGFVAKGPLSPASWAYDKNFAGITFDLNKAKAELAQSGVSNVSFPLVISSGNPTILQEAQFIQSQLQAVGINISLKQETFATLVTDFQTFNYQSLLVGWTGSVDPDGTMYAMFYSTGGFNYTKYANAQVDSLLNSGRTTLDQAQRVPFYQQAQNIIVQDASRVFLTHGAVAQTTTSNVKNYPLYPSGVVDLTSVYLTK